MNHSSFLICKLSQNIISRILKKGGNVKQSPEVQWIAPPFPNECSLNALSLSHTNHPLKITIKLFLKLSNRTLWTLRTKNDKYYIYVNFIWYYSIDNTYVPHLGACQYDQTGEIPILAHQHPPSPIAPNNYLHRRNPKNIICVNKYVPM